MKKNILNSLAVLVLLIITPDMNAQSQDLSGLLPDRIKKYTMSGDDTYYNPENLFDYINGGAELFISYNFDKVISRRYSQKGEPDIVVEIFDMQESRNAFGVFSHDRERIDNTYGQGSEVYQGAILFWQDRYYVSVFTEKENEVSGPAIKELAASIAKLIPGKGALPEILNYLPGEGLVKESVFYFHHYIWLNAFFYIASDNFLNINDDTDAVLAKYGKPESRYYLLVVAYKTAEDAHAAYKSFIENYAPELKDARSVKLEDKKWTAAGTKGEILVCVFNAPGQQEAENLLGNTLQ